MNLTESVVRIDPGIKERNLYIGWQISNYFSFFWKD